MAGYSYEMGNRTSTRIWIIVTGILLIFNIHTAIAAEDTIRLVIEGLDDTEKKNVEAILAPPTELIKEGGSDVDLWLRRFENQIPDKVKEALSPFGYYQPETTVIRETNNEDFHTLRVIIQKGEPVRVLSARVAVEGPGADEETLKTLVARFPLQKGSILRQNIYENEKEALQNTALELGYINAVFPVHTIRVSVEKLEAEIELILYTGPQYRFGDTTFSGTAGYPPAFIGRYLDYRKGEVFSHKKLAQTQTNFVSTGRFERINIRPGYEKAENYHIPIDIEVTPAATKRFKIGGGYGTDTGPRGSLYFRDINVIKRGHEFTAELTAGTILQGLAAGYTIPGDRDTNTYTSFKAALKREDTESYLTESVTLEGERARSFGKGRTGSFFVQLLKENSEAGEDRTNKFLIIPGIRFNGRWYDQVVRPVRGFRFQTELRGTNRFLGSDLDFFQVLSSGEALFPLPARFSVFARAKAGTTALHESMKELPISLRFFAGGDNSVRGYGYQSLGPKDDDGNVVGGKHLLTVNIELEKAIGKNWGVAAFYDFGNAFDSISDMGIVQGAGLGFRYYTPVGPIKLDLARQIGVRNPGYRIHFSIGLEL